MRLSYIHILFVVHLYLLSCSPELPQDVADAYKKLPDDLDYNVQVKPILSDKCFSCHGPDKNKRKAGLRLDQSEFAFANLPENPDKVAIDPGNIEGSELFHRILSSDPDYMMPEPDSHLSLSADEKAILIKWINDGAIYKPHWAFLKPEKVNVPEVDNENNVINPIDNFIIDKLKQEKLSPSNEADKEILLRRLSLDLTGLPPTVEEIDNFLKDNTPDAYEKQVDRLLNSPHYGEKMAVDWLDLARYADSHGYTVDRLRDMSPYRDWVIQAFNSNFPYDKFIHWQLAGDLMPSPSKEMIIATAFNRNHQQNMEGGIVEEEFQTEYVVDRTNTLGEAFLGLSVGCARCHDHKFDPITQKNYYELFGFFNNVKEAGQISWDDALPTPTLMLPTKEQQKIIHYITTSIAEQEKKVIQSKNNTTDFEKWLNRESYASLSKQIIPSPGLQANYSFDDGSLKNKINSRQTGTMKLETGESGGAPVFTSRDKSKALVLNGDVWLDLNDVGVFRRSEAFTIGIRVNIPKELKEGVIFHKSLAERLYNFRGYHLYLKGNRLELNMAHTAPSNAITKITTNTIPKDTWIQLTVTYDGSSRADGFKLYLDGEEMAMKTTMDQLTKDILYIPSSVKTQPGLQVGAWWRGLGLKNGKVDDILVYNRVLTPSEIKIISGKGSWSQLSAKKKDELTTQERDALKEYYFSTIDQSQLSNQKKIQQLRTKLSDSTEDIEELMVMQEMSQPRNTFVLKRGNYDAPGEKVFPATPASILSFPSNLPKNRYGLAQWLTHEDNPLTARVIVNRCWQNFFGVGLVKTTEDFGNQGEMPSHPQLLDWLAVTFRKSGWNMKELNKLIVMSATYRQDSRTSNEVRERDPENRLLARGPSNRMTAEMIRDNALMASGLINKQIGGKSVKPYQPDGLWEINNTHYQPDSGNAVYRRSLYVLIKRSVPNPTLATFDATARSYCVVRRQKTNTPLQALVTLNDPTFIEAARAMGEQMTRNSDLKKSIVNTYRKLTGRTPSSAEIDLLTDLQQSQLKKFEQHPQKTKGWLVSGQYRVDNKLSASVVAANTVVASTILNSDATLTKR